MLMLLALTLGMPFVVVTAEDIPLGDIDTDDIDWQPYLEDLGTRTLGFGAGLGVVFGILMVVGCFARCCCCTSYYLERVRASKRFRHLCFITFMVVAGLLGLLLMLFAGLQAADDVDVTLDNSLVALDEYRDMLCTRADEDAYAYQDVTLCTESSMGGFVHNTRTLNTDMMTSARLVLDLAAFATAVTDLKQNTISPAKTDIDEVKTLATTGEERSVRIATSINWLLNTDNTGDVNFVSDIPAISDIPLVTSGDVTMVQNSVDDTANALSAVTTLANSVSALRAPRTGGIPNAILGLEAVEYQVSGVLLDLEDEVWNGMENADSGTRRVGDAEEEVAEYEDYNSFALPALFFLLFLPILCGGYGVYTTNPGCTRYCSICIFLIQIYFTAVFGAIFATTVHLDDWCGQHIRIIEVEGVDVKEVSVGGAEVDLAPHVEAILNCPTELGGVTPDNNLVDILGLGGEFDVSDLADVGRGRVEGVRDTVDGYKQDLSQTEVFMSGLDNTISWDTREAQSTLPVSISEVNTLLGSLPPAQDAANFDRGDATQQGKLESTYGGSWGFTFSAEYNDALVEINGYLAGLASGGPARIESVDFKVIVEFTEAYVTDPSYAYESDLGTATYEALLDVVRVTDGYTTTTSAAWAANTDVVHELTALDGDLTDHDTDLTRVEVLQGELEQARDGSYVELADLESQVDVKVGGMNGIVADLDELEFELGTANSYTMCGWMGRSYDTLVSTGICEDFHGDLEMASAGMLLVICASFLTFFVFLCAPRWMTNAADVRETVVFKDGEFVTVDNPARKNNAGVVALPGLASEGAGPPSRIRYQTSFVYKDEGAMPRAPTPSAPPQV